MERVAEVGKQHEPSPAVAGHAHAASSATASLPPALELQQLAGNQAMQQLFRSGFIQAKLAISNPDDPEEREADNVAHTIMRKHAGAPCSCSPGEEMCEECQQRQSAPAIQRHASSPSAPGHVPRIVSDVLRSPGHPLDSATRAFFEPRFGRDFSNVRIHTGADAVASARSINAHAYTAGSHIAFASGQYSPETPTGRSLLAHELTHVLQQGSVATPSPLVRSHSISRICRQTDDSPPPAPTEVQDSPKEEASWRSRVDAAVRSMFGLKGKGLTSANVRFLDQTTFGQQFTGSDLEEKLFTIFLDNYNSGEPGLILETNQVAIAKTGPSPLAIAGLHDFVKEGIAKGSFHGQTREVDVAAELADPNGPLHFLPGIDRTPQELVSEYIGGVTDISGPRSRRTIKINVAGGTFQVDTLVHEACHFYSSEAFRNMVSARTDGEDFIGNARISQILTEGVAEYFTRQVMQANAASFGTSANSYQNEVDQVERIVLTLGQTSLRSAFFGGDAGQIRRLSAAVDEYKDISEDLLVPGFVVDLRIKEAAAAPSTPPVRRSASQPATPTHAPGLVHDVLRSPGHPLDSATRAFFEPRFGRDFSDVRVHNGTDAAASARSINAHAYTAGSHIAFDSGQYSPDTTQGRTLLAHELTHVIQDRTSQSSKTRLQENVDGEESRSFASEQSVPNAPRILRQTTEGGEQATPPVDAQSVKTAADVILKALKGITTKGDSANILQQFKGKSGAFMNAILQELKSRAGQYDETPTGMVQWLFHDMTAEDRRDLRTLLMANHVLFDLGPILVGELTDALGSLLDSSQDVMGILTQLSGADLESILSQLETTTKRSDSATALYLFGEIDRVSAEKLRTHFIQHGNQRAWQYVAYFTASKIHKLVSGFLGLVSHSESTMVVDNFTALGSPALCQLTQQELDKLTRSSDKVPADEQLFQKLDPSDYDKLQKVSGLTLRAFVRAPSTLDTLASGAKWGLMVAEWTTCGVIGIATGLLAAVWDLVKGVWDIVTAAGHLFGCLTYLCSGFTVGSEDWLAVKDFFLGMGHVFKDPKAAWDQLWGQLKAEFRTIEGPFADCKRAEFIVRKFVGVIVNVLLIALAGYGLVKAGVSAVVEFSELAEEVGVIRALGQTAAKAGRAIVKFVSAKSEEIGKVARALGRPIETLMKVRKQLNGILLAVDNEGVYAALRKRGEALLDNERKFWNENKEAWKNRALKSQQKQIQLEEEAGTIQNALDTSQVPENGTKVVDDVAGKADGLSNEAGALEGDVTNEAPSKQTTPETPSTPATPEADRAFLETTKKPTAELSNQEIQHELEIADRSPGRPSSDGDYVEEIPLSNEHEWKVKESGATCRFSNPICFVNRYKGKPTAAPQGWRIQFVDVNNLPDIVPPDVVLEFPTGERVWRSAGEEGGIVIESRLGPAQGRKGFEKEYFSRGEMGTPEYKKSKMERAHSQGQGTGFESPYAIPYAPAEVNQALQNTGIEMYLRFLENNKAPGVDYRLLTETTMHPGTRNMKSISYAIHAEYGGQSRPLFELRINVEDTIENPKVWIDDVKMSDDPNAVQLLHFGDLPDDLRERLRMLLGNRLPSGNIQPKLTTSNPDDPEEREADNVASTIMRKAAGAPCSCSPGEEMCEECQQKQSAPAIQRRATSPAPPAYVPRLVSDVLRSPGHPLDSATRAFFEPRFGRDFSHVRVHTGADAAESARSIHAHAYTAGSDIVFASGQYSPDTSSGRSLLAHELTHVTQQRGQVTAIQREPDDDSDPEDRQGPLTEAEEQVLKRILKIADKKKIYVGVQAKIEIEGDPSEDMLIKSDEPFTKYSKERAEAVGGTGRAARLPPVGNPPDSGGKAGFTQPSSGVVIEPVKGSHEVEVLTWNTGDPVKLSDVSHAETQFEKWLESRDPKWIKRVKSITLTVFGLDICEECEGRLANLKKQYPHIKFSWVSGSSGAPLKNYPAPRKKRPKGKPSGSSGEPEPAKKPAMPETQAGKPSVEPPTPTTKPAEPASRPSPRGPESTTEPAKSASKPSANVPESSTQPSSTAHEAEARHRGSQGITAIESALNLASTKSAEEFGLAATKEAMNFAAPRLMRLKAVYDSLNNLYAAWGTENFWIAATDEACSWTLNAMGPMGQAIKVAYKFHFAALASMLEKNDFARSIGKSAEDLEKGAHQLEMIVDTLRTVDSELPVPGDLAPDMAFWSSIPQAFSYLDEYWHVSGEVWNSASHIRVKLHTILENWLHIVAIAEQTDDVTRGFVLSALDDVNLRFKNGKGFQGFVENLDERAKTLEIWAGVRVRWAHEALESYGYFGKHFQRQLSFTECNKALAQDPQRWVQECFINRWEDWIED